MRFILSQVVEAFAEFGKWWRIALFSLKRQYTTTMLGPLWLFVPNFVFIAIVGAVYSSAFDVSGLRYFAYVAFGYVIWVFILESFGRGGNLFVAEYGRFSQIRTNLFGIVLKELIARGIILVVNLLICVAALGIAEGSLRDPTVALGGLLLLLVNSFMLSYWLSAVSARFRDIVPVVASIMRLMFFVTPIFWFAENFREGLRIWLLHVNPFYHLMELVRGPLLDGTVPADVPAFAAFWTAANLCAFLVVAGVFHRRIIYDAA